MAKAPKFNKKRSMRRKRSSRTQKISASFANKVKRVIAKDVETKVANYSSNVTAFNQQMNSTGDCLRIMPQIAASVNQNGRIGTEIKLQGIQLRGTLTFTLGQTSASNTRVGVRMLILRSKRFDDWNAAALDFASSYNKLLEGSATGFTGLVTDFNTPVNRELFSVVADKRFYMSQSVGVSTSDLVNTTKFINMKIPYTRRKIKYDNEYSALEAANFPLFALIGYTKLDGSIADAGATTYLTFQYNTTAYYEDA